MYPITTVTVIGENEMLDAGKMYLRRRQVIFITAYLIMLCTIAAGTIQLYAVFRKVNVPGVVAVVLALAGVLYYAFGAPALYKKRIKKEFLRIGERRVVRDFYEDHMQSRVECANASGDESINYSLLTKVIETDKYFFIFVSKNTYVLTAKKELSEDSVVAIRSLLSSALPPKKYKLKTRDA